MDIRPDVALIILGCALVTLLPRIVPFLLMHRMRLPDWARHWLSFVPVTVMSALALDGVQGSAHPLPVRMAACAACLAVALWSRSLFLTVLAGVAICSFAGPILEILR